MVAAALGGSAVQATTSEGAGITRVIKTGNGTPGWDEGTGVISGLNSGIRAITRMCLGTKAISRLQDIPSYSTSTPRGTGAAANLDKVRRPFRDETLDEEV